MKNTLFLCMLFCMFTKFFMADQGLSAQNLAIDALFPAESTMDPSVVVDSDSETFYVNENAPFMIEVYLSKPVESCIIELNVDKNGLEIMPIGDYTQTYIYEGNDFLITESTPFNSIKIFFEEDTQTFTQFKLIDVYVYENDNGYTNPIEADLPPLQYNYDAAGNMVFREIVLSSSSQKSGTRINGEPDKTYSDNLLNKEIKIYPNPTKGELKVEISDIDVDEMVGFKIYSLSGDIIFFSNEPDPIIDIQDQPKGIYLLEIRINGKSQVWRIIKE